MEKSYFNKYYSVLKITNIILVYLLEKYIFKYNHFDTYFNRNLIQNNKTIKIYNKL